MYKGLERALDKQVNGTHYKKFIIQPAEFCFANKIGYLEATAIKYLCRWKDKGGVGDLDKAIHFIEILKELEEKYASNDNVGNIQKVLDDSCGGR